MKVMLLLAAAVVSFMMFGTDNAEAAEKQADKKILIAYFSWSGNTREAAAHIQKRTGGTIFEIKAVKPYPTVYRECTDYAKKELADNARPALTAEVADMASYDVIFVGYPNWWGTMPMPVFTFLEKYNLTGKTIVPFCTHAGSGLGRSQQDIAKLCPKSKILEGIAVRGSDAAGAQDEIAEWLRNIGMDK